MNNSSLSAEDIESVLLDGGLDNETIQEILRHHKSGKENDFLREYQGALSLWAEHNQDVRKK